MMVESKGYRHGPGRSKSLKDTPVDERADPSNTARSFVVLLDSFTTLCISRWKEEEGGTLRLVSGTGLAWLKFRYS